MIFPIIIVYFLFMKPIPNLQKIDFFNEKHNSSKLNIISVHEFKNKLEETVIVSNN